MTTVSDQAEGRFPRQGVSRKEKSHHNRRDLRLMERETGLEPATTCLEAVVNGFPSPRLNSPRNPEPGVSRGRRSLPVSPRRIMALKHRRMQYV